MDRIRHILTLSGLTPKPLPFFIDPLSFFCFAGFFPTFLASRIGKSGGDFPGYSLHLKLSPDISKEEMYKAPNLYCYAMKTLITSPLAILLVLAAAVVTPADEKAVMSISTEALNRISVIGKLGIPLGEVATVKATIVDGDALRTKADMGSYLLRVAEVNGVKLKAEPILDFTLASGSRMKLAKDNFELYELKTGKKTGELTGLETKKLKQNYVGKTLSLQVYELGGFSGMPKNLPQEVTAWPDRGSRNSMTCLDLIDSLWI